MDKSKNYPYCDFFQHHNKDFNGGLCPCGDSFKLDGELRCARTPERIKEYRAGGYYYKCEYMITKKHSGQITLF